MAYSDKYGSFFGRLTDEGNVAVLHVEDGAAATRLDATVYPVGSELGARYEHPEGIVLSREDADRLGIEIEQDGVARSYPVYDVTRADYTRDCEPVGQASSAAEALAILKRVLGDEAPAAVELNDRDTRGGQLWAYWPL